MKRFFMEPDASKKNCVNIHFVYEENESYMCV